MSGAGGLASRGGVNVGGGSSTGRAVFAVCGGLAGAYYGFYLQSKYIEERRVSPPCSPLHSLVARQLTFVCVDGWQVRALVEIEARKRLDEERAVTQE
ncbi:hypothetical protein BBJ28_00003023 [Nothophytophthora sp. Chile5]|nr:hypothetical protein BBJ28_00003023 [Nothophytophthora sp. Chile5]